MLKKRMELKKDRFRPNIFYKIEVKYFKTFKIKTRMELFWNQARMRIEMKLRCYLVIWSLVICNL